MGKNSIYLLSVFLFALSVPVAEATSRCVDFLYRKNAALLAVFPAGVPRLRRPLLALGFFACGFLFLPAMMSDWPEAAPPDKFSCLLSLAGAFLLFVITGTDNLPLFAGIVNTP